MVLSILVVLFYGILTVVVLIKVKASEKNKVQPNDGSKQEKSKWNFLISEINNDVKGAAYVIALNGLKDFLIPIVVVFSVENLVG